MSRSGATARHGHSLSLRRRIGISAPRSASSTSSGEPKSPAARFTALVGPGARLARALINFMLDLHTKEHGYTEVEPPFMANSASLTGTGNLPKFEADLFKIAGEWDLYMVPTAEVPLTNMHRGEILDGARRCRFATRLTRRAFAARPDSYGADVRGLIRQHQFDKVELMVFTRQTLHTTNWSGLPATLKKCSSV